MKILQDINRAPDLQVSFLRENYSVSPLFFGKY